MMVTNKLSIFARVCDSFCKKQEVAFQMIWNVTDGFIHHLVSPWFCQRIKTGRPRETGNE